MTEVTAPHAANDLHGSTAAADRPTPAVGLPMLVAFDFDGTICDSIEAIREGMNAVRDRYAFPYISEDDVRGFREMTATDVRRKLGIHPLLVPVIARHVRRLMRQRMADIPPIDGMTELLLRLQREGHVVAIVTSNRRPNVEAFFEAHGLPQVVRILDGARLQGKARHLERLRQEFGHRVSHIVYVGDEVRDVAASRKAGVYVAAVTWGANSEGALRSVGPNWLCSTADALTAAIESASSLPSNATKAGDSWAPLFSRLVDRSSRVASARTKVLRPILNLAKTTGVAPRIVDRVRRRFG